MAEVARLEGRLAIDGIRQAQGDLRAFDSAMKDAERSANSAAGGVEKSAGKMGSALSGVAKAAALAGTAIGAGLAAGIGASIKVAADFQQSLANVGSATGATTDQMADMRKEALKIGADTSKSATEAVAAMGELVKAGLDVETVVGGAARATVQLAEATGIDMVEAATLTSNAMNTFKAEGLDAATAATTFAKAANASAIDVSDLGQSLSAVGAVWSTSGQNMQDFATAVGLLGNNAIRGSDAGTSLKAMLAGLTPNSKQAAAAMQELGINAFNADGSFKSFRDIVGNLQQAFGPLNEQQRATYGEMIFGSDAVRSLNVLLKEGTTGWDAFQESMAQAPSLAEQSAMRMNTLSGQLEMLKGSLETIAIEIGSLFLPGLTRLVGFLAGNVGPAFDALRTRMTGLWANIGPEATAAGAAIVSGLTAASTWITTTFLPAAQRVAGDIWTEVGPKAQAAAQAITDGLQGAVSWLQTNGPAMTSALVQAFERARSEIAPILSDIVSDIESALSQIDTSAIENEITVSFQNMAEAAQGVDFSPLVNAFQPLIQEARNWVAFVNQNFSQASTNLQESLQAGRDQLNQMLPDWVNLENAGRVAAGAVVAAAASIAGGVANMAAGVRNSSQIPIDILNRDWPAAFQSAGQAALAMASSLPPVSVAITAVRVAVELLGGALSSAAGFVGGLVSGLASLAGTASSVVGPLQGVLGVLSSIGAAKGALDFVLPGSLPPLAQGVKDVGEQASEAAGGMSEFRSAAGDWVTIAARVTGSVRENQSALARLTLEIARLNEQLAYVEPHSEREAALKAEIATLQAWQGQIQAGISILDAEAKALELSKTALDGAVEARSKFLMQQSDIARFGAGGAEVMGGILTALTENTGESGRDAYAGLEDFIEGLKDTLGPRAQESGNYLRFLFFETLAATGADREAALARFETFFGELQAQSQAQMTVSAQTMNSALTGALFDEATKASLGEKAAGLRTAIAGMLDVSGTPEAQAAMENVAGLVAGFEAEIRKLPASVQGPILAEYQAAMRAFADAPTDADVIGNLERVVSEAERAIAFIPKNLDKLAPEMRAAAINLWEQVKAGLTSAEEAGERFQQALSMIPQEMAKLGPEVRSEIQRIIDGFVAMGGSAEQAGEAIEQAMQRAADSAAAAATAIPKQLSGPEMAMAVTRAGGGGGGGFGGLTGGNAGAQLLSLAISHAGAADPRLAAQYAAWLEEIAKGMAAETSAIETELRQQEHLRQMTLKIRPAERDEANMILTDLSEGLISIDDAIRELLELLRDQRRKGDQPVQTNLYVDGWQLATVTAPYISQTIATSVTATAGIG